MVPSIEAEFRQRCAENDDFRLLLAQWEYDHRLFGAALATIGRTFPHYSLHDVSHSKTILLRIASLLGTENLKRLGATDLWLLLEAAYLHDTGMVVLFATQQEDLRSEAFYAHLNNACQSTDRDLARAATAVKSKTGRYTPEEILAGHFDLLLVYAAFVRSKHPERAQAFAIDPHTSLAVSSPRTPLIPSRFWHIIGLICRSHGESSEFVFSLSQQESGLAGDICHPRFVACMLRLGDLLDLDSGRFCPVLNATIPRMPHLSAAHKRKHDGVIRLLVTPQRIDVYALYTDDVDAYLEAESWFDWLRSELRDQLLRWCDIAPNESFDPLPSIGAIEARLEGQLLFEKRARPRFELQREKVLELVRGANLYASECDALREVVQNAIDATVLRLEYERRSVDGAPLREMLDLRDRLAAWPIHVTISRGESSPRSASEVEWTLTIVDQGLGMQLGDVGHLLRLGSSSSNLNRRRLVDSLPHWARPSGTFGIGFHSLFEYFHDVRVTTRHPEDPDGLEIWFEKREIGADEPSVVVKKCVRAPGQMPRQVGTVVTASIRVPRIPSYVSFPDHEESATNKVVSSYDFVVDEELPYTAAQLRDAVRELAETSICAFVLDGKPCLRQGAISPGGGSSQFLATEGIELGLLYASHFGGRRDRVRYRGVEAECRMHFDILSLDCNVHAGDARDMLELSRNKFTSRGRRTVVEKVVSGLRTCLPVWLAEAREKHSASLASLSLYAFLSEGHGDCGDEWRSLQALRSHWPHTTTPDLLLGQLADAEEAELHFISELRSHNAKPVPCEVKPSGTKLLITHLEHNSYWWPHFLRKIFKARTYVGVSSITGGSHYRLLRSNIVEEDVLDAALRHVLLRRRSLDVGCRDTIPCPKVFASLSLPDGTRAGWNHQSSLILQTMANPFVYRRDGVAIPHLEVYCRWLAAQRNEVVASVALEVEKFLRHADQLIDPNEQRLYDISSELRILASLR